MSEQKFPTEYWAVFNGHVNDANTRALKVCRARFSDSPETLADLEAALQDGTMSIFQRERSPASELFASACFIFANGLDKP